MLCAIIATQEEAVGLVLLPGAVPALGPGCYRVLNDAGVRGLPHGLVQNSMKVLMKFAACIFKALLSP